MRRRLWLLVVVATFGCTREATPAPRQPVGAASEVPRLPPPPSPPSEPPPPPPSEPPRFLVTELAPTQGDLTPLLQVQGEYGRGKQLHPVAYFYAEWCLTCRVLQKTLDDPRMADTLRGTYVIKLNLDDWHDKLAGTGYVVKSIPILFLVGTDGNPMGTPFKWWRAWGLPSNPRQVSPLLRRFLGQPAALP